MTTNTPIDDSPHELNNAIDAWNERQRIARAEYEAHPIISCAADWIDEDGERTPCGGIAGKRGICKNHVAAFVAQGVQQS